MMDTRTGRWLMEDPEGFSAEDMNLYRYVKNSPTNATDPTGLEGKKVEIERDIPKDVKPVKVDGREKEFRSWA
jgi:hypothetical protein